MKLNIKKDYFWGWTFSCIPILGFLLFGFLPLIMAVIMSFSTIKNFDLTTLEFVRFDNYVALFTRPTLQKVLSSFKYTFINTLSVPISMVLSLFVSVLLTRKVKGVKVFRVIFFIPFVCSVAALSLMWGFMLDQNFGIINEFLGYLGFEPVNWMGKAEYVMPAMIFMGIWSGMGFNIILFSAALNNVNTVYYEAADIDGAGKMKKFFSITLPCISPTTFFLFVMGMIGALQEFVRFQIMARSSGVYTTVYEIYRMGYEQVFSYGIGQASALALILAAIVIGITVLNFKVSQRLVNYD